MYPFDFAASYTVSDPILLLAKRYVFVYARLKGSNKEPPSPPPVLEPIERLCIYLTSTISLGKIYSF